MYITYTFLLYTLLNHVVQLVLSDGPPLFILPS